MGASLLAIAADHSTSMLNDTPPSRASSLPQGSGSSRITLVFDSMPAHHHMAERRDVGLQRHQSTD
ncbi:hypothetical protein C1X61_20010 [Pseudomonas sp. FW215-T2]|nr:hypothetical protein C1X61_20010 [Pseudomonas sp. FW215-T2]PNA09220.1 hypothetical protein C1X62_22040 [Pseudomonas sp. FW215-R3]PNB35652.1 hypothetical protein C1X63_21200 [Pseudomonas sp. FW305-131]